MPRDSFFEIPTINDDDVDEILSQLKMAAIDEPRRNFLKSPTTIDVSACPGSGKTTLIVAKLAILAKKWGSATKGICVLSHTKVAREEIEALLGDSAAGQKLLSYPHYIGTIHGFMNKFLALPWLRSNGFPVVAVDNEITEAYRRKILGPRKVQTIQTVLSHRRLDFSGLRLVSPNFQFDVRGKDFPTRDQTRDSYVFAQEAVKASAEAGYFCYDEMFVWARTLLQENPVAAEALRERFPLIFLDEMQDTSEEQSLLLNEIFPRQNQSIIVQRVGDPNQAIFEYAGASQTIETDPFPDETQLMSIPNSFRFGQEIADLANPLACHEVTPSGLKGMGPKKFSDLQLQNRNAIFLFSDDQAASVLEVYANYLLSEFPDKILKSGKFTAIGAIHTDQSADIQAGHNHFPKGIWHYWAEYNPVLSRKQPSPKTFVEYVFTQQRGIKDGNDAYAGVSLIAEAFIRLSDHLGEPDSIKRRHNKHRAIISALQEDAECLTLYQSFQEKFSISKTPLTEEVWQALKPNVIRIAAALCQPDTTDTRQGQSFLAWTTPEETQIERPGEQPNPNVYTLSTNEKFVAIDLGSIHSVKGQTHTGTLVLDTYRNGHVFTKLMPWISGQKNGQGIEGQRNVERLLQTYVAMTRPTHLLCLAMKESSIGAGETATANINTLKEHGWRVAKIENGVANWL